MYRKKGGITMYKHDWTTGRITALALCLIAAVAVLSLGAARADGGLGSPFGITLHDPWTNEVGVALNHNVYTMFDDDVNPATVTNDTFVVHGHLGGLASGTLSYDGGTATLTLNPDRGFHAGEVLRVSATSGISSTGGAGLAPYGWQFTAGTVVDRRVAGFADIGAVLTGVFEGDVAWGDYDNDGDLDVLLTGDDGSYPPVSKVYRNDGGAVFTNIGAGLTPVIKGSVAWGDYDSDGDLDILLTGLDVVNEVSKVYRNDGGGVFSDTGAALTGVYDSAVAWGDYDNDGDLDILLTGVAYGSPLSIVYRNDAPSGFTDIGAGLAGVVDGSVAWGDYDNDGDLDILLTGNSAGGRVSMVYRNDGTPASPGFTDIGAGLTGVDDSSAAWGDYDNDGDLDILLTGKWLPDIDYVRVSKVYRNDTPSGFTDIGAALTGVEDGSVAWGDYDNDGDLDILLTGDAGATDVSKVYRNDGPSAFTDIGAGLTGVTHSSVAWGDYDDDGDLDILLTGYGGSSLVSRVYRNNSRPELGSMTPASGSGPVGVTTYFTTTWSDPDGPENLKQCYFHIGDSPALAGNVTLLYNAAKDKLWLLEDSGTSWLGGCQPGDLLSVLNSQAILDCSQTTVQGLGDTLSVTWALEFRPGFEGSKKLGLKCKDRDKAKAKGKWKGTWTIAE
jgi:hypothetical protein